MLGSTTLFIKHLPPELNAADREELLKRVGAVKVRIMPDEGKMKYSAFATFANHDDAKYALSLLHQREILNRHLVVEFSKKQHENLIPHLSDYSKFQTEASKDVTKSTEKEVLRADMEEFSRKMHGVAPALGLDYLPSPLLKYKYPPATPTIIQNISHALASVPKFYVQVLHLMNKMNLPAPFGPLTPAPPLTPDVPVNESVDIVVGDSHYVENMDVSSEEESEYESEPDDQKPKVIEKILPQKRAVQKTKQKKKPKFSDFIPVSSSSSTKQHTEPSDVFESQPLSQKKISMKNIEKINPVATAMSYETTGGFGAIEPSKVSDDSSENKLDSGEKCWNTSQFITLEELKKKRISPKEMKTMSIFRNFSPGEPTFRLYIKNLAKQVDEKDLHYIFGRFIDLNSESDKNMFDIRLMKEGRMKGQAFVTLANEKQAIAAIKETNGFVLHTKPLVVQFARSAKPKEEEKKEK